MIYFKLCKETGEQYEEVITRLYSFIHSFIHCNIPSIPSRLQSMPDRYRTSHSSYIHMLYKKSIGQINNRPNNLSSYLNIINIHSNNHHSIHIPKNDKTITTKCLKYINHYKITLELVIN
jgi:hypothetical protein